MKKEKSVSLEAALGWEVCGEKVFTDREIPQEIFERKYEVLQKNWKQKSYVLCYYGIGGIGKTSFLNKLCRVIRGEEGNECRILKKVDCDYIKYDFGDKGAAFDKLSLLLRWRRQFKKVNRKFRFGLFDAAVLFYAQKTGAPVEKDDMVSGMVTGNSWVSGFLTVVSAIPVFGVYIGAVQAADLLAGTGINVWKTYAERKKYKKYLREMDGMEPSELLDKIQEYFILDMYRNMSEIAKRPMVVFLDTYEKFVDSVNREWEMIVEDYWLRKGPKSLIRCIPGILWVIASRDKLYWAEDDVFWTEGKTEKQPDERDGEEPIVPAEARLQQYLMGDLSKEDATFFLQRAGIREDALCEQLYKLTCGTPLYLDICVETYQELTASGKEPVIDEFGKDINELISRYLACMDAKGKEMAYFLAAVGTWTEESIREISKRMHTMQGYSLAGYRAFIKHSFIVKNSDEFYYMHGTVRVAVLKMADEDMLEEVSRIKQDIAREKLEEADSLGKNVLVKEYMEVVKESKQGYKTFYDSQKVVIREMRKLKDKGDYNLLLMLSRELYEHVKEKYPQTGAEIIAASEYGEALRLYGMSGEAFRVVENIPTDENVFGIEELDWLQMKLLIANVLYAKGDYAKAKDLAIQVYKGRKAILGSEHPETCRTVYCMIASLSGLRAYEFATKIGEEILRIQKRILGEEHQDVLRTMSNLARVYLKQEEYIKSVQMRMQVYEKQKKVFGEVHPETLNSRLEISALYYKLEDYVEAKKIQENVLEVCRMHLGEKSRTTIRAMVYLADTLTVLGDKMALDLVAQIYEIRKEMLGEQAPETLRTRAYLENLNRKLGDYKSVDEQEHHSENFKNNPKK